MTKPAPDENLLKCPISIEEIHKVPPSVAEMLEKNAFIIPNVHADFAEEVKPRVRSTKTKMNSRRNRLKKITEKLYNLEPSGEPEKGLKIELDLYQMENF